MTSVSVIVPVFNNADTLGDLCRRLEIAFSGRYPDYEIILVDDGSRDNSWETIRQLGASSQRVRGVRLSRNFGQQLAIGAGFEVAQGDRIVLMDADLEDRPESVPPLLDRLVDPIDVIYTTFVVEGAKEHLRFTSYLYHKVFSLVTKTSVPRNVGTLRVFNRKMLSAILKYGEFNVIWGPLMFFVGFNSDCIPVVRDLRKGGRSSYTFFRRLKLAFSTLASYTNFPITMLFGMGTVMFTSSFAYASVILVSYILFGTSLPPGITLLTLLLLVTFGATLFALGIIGSYVFRVYQEVLHRPRYLTMEMVNMPIRTPTTETKAALVEK